MSYDSLPSSETVEKTIAALNAHNIQAEIADSKEAALARIKELIPAGASVSSGTSVSLEEIGFVDFLKSGAHSWNNLKAAFANEKDPVKQAQLRKASSLADYYLGSVHAATEDGQLLIASKTGSQLPGYIYSAGNVIWVVGTQKIVPNIDEAMKRLTEYVIPLEEVHMQQLYNSHTSPNKILIFREEMPGRVVRVIFVNEKLGF